MAKDIKIYKLKDIIHRTEAGEMDYQQSMAAIHEMAVLGEGWPLTPFAIGGGERGSAIVFACSSPVPDTCFALLFLARGTTPVVRIPGRVMTGVDRK